jgi:hypothetical protein
MQKHVNAKIYLLSLFLCRHGTEYTGPWRMQKAENIFMMIFYNAYGNKHANLNMQCRI